MYSFLFCTHTALAILPPLRRQECLLLYTESVRALAGSAIDAHPKNAEFVQKSTTGLPTCRKGGWLRRTVGAV